MLVGGHSDSIGNDHQQQTKSCGVKTNYFSEILVINSYTHNIEISTPALYTVAVLASMCGTLATRGVNECV